LGGRIETSFDCYNEVLESTVLGKEIESFQIALSQTKEKRYVQDVLLKQQTEVAKTLKNGGVFMLCGSMWILNSLRFVLYLNFELWFLSVS